MKTIQRHICKKCKVQFNLESSVCPSCDEETAISAYADYRERCQAGQKTEDDEEIYEPNSCGSGAAICSPSSWTGDETVLPIIRTGPTIRCHGDAIIDALRVARARLDRTLKTLRTCADKALRHQDRYEVGPYLKDVLDDLLDGEIDSMNDHWFSSRSDNVLECVLNAEGYDDEDEDDYPIPEEPTWKVFRALSKALRDHSTSLKLLKDSENDHE